MRILYVCHRFPYPPKRGGKIRPFNMIRHLARSHEVVVCSLARSPQEAEEARGIAPLLHGFPRAACARVGADCAHDRHAADARHGLHVLLPQPGAAADHRPRTGRASAST